MASQRGVVQPYTGVVVTPRFVVFDEGRRLQNEENFPVDPVGFLQVELDGLFGQSPSTVAVRVEE